MKSLFALWVFAIASVSGTFVQGEEPKKLVVGAGCFWCVEAIFEQQPGVLNAVSGFAGGSVPNPTYKQVCTGTTGHAEVVEIAYDPSKTSVGKLLEVFWKSHDPTNPNGVWPDFGPQYRSIILYNDAEQKREIDAAVEAAKPHFPKPIATQVVPLQAFYPADESHQDYVCRNPHSPYVEEVTLERLKKLGLGIPQPK